MLSVLLFGSGSRGLQDLGSLKLRGLAELLSVQVFPEWPASRLSRSQNTPSLKKDQRCLVYNMATELEAESLSLSGKSLPKTGCSGCFQPPALAVDHSDSHRMTPHYIEAGLDTLIIHCGEVAVSL